MKFKNRYEAEEYVSKIIDKYVHDHFCGFRLPLIVILRRRYHDCEEYEYYNGILIPDAVGFTFLDDLWKGPTDMDVIAIITMGAHDSWYIENEEIERLLKKGVKMLNGDEDE